ncbi:hypothetical protein BVY02_00670 [bacterium J17]|nr:hypothetical protein BVY02_00670 [bacterium J17]
MNKELCDFRIFLCEEKKWLRKVHSYFQIKLSQVDKELLRSPAILDSRSSRSLTTIRRILTALSERLENIEDILVCDSYEQMLSAYRQLGENLVVSNDVMNRLLDEERIAPVARERVVPMLEELFSSIQFVEGVHSFAMESKPKKSNGVKWL